MNDTLTPGQRICLSQERAAIMGCLDQLNENPDAQVQPRYRMPDHLDQKVRHLYGVMVQQGHR